MRRRMQSCHFPPLRECGASNPTFRSRVRNGGLTLHIPGIGSEGALNRFQRILLLHASPLQRSHSFFVGYCGG